MSPRRPTHPIRRLLKDLELHHSAEAPASDRDIYQRVIARHVKPLLDALEFDHTERWKHKHDTHCETCRLLDVWRANP